MNYTEIFPFFLQGITEFFPVSSSAHLLLFAKWFNIGGMDIGILAMLHLIPVFVFILYFQKEVRNLLLTFFYFLLYPFKKLQRAQNDIRFFESIACAVVPVMLCGVVIEVYHCDLYAFKATTVIGISSIIFGILLGVSDKIQPVSAQNELTIRKSVVFGLMHMLALIPGVSRLGISLTAARLLGLGRQASVRFAFIAGIPILLAAGSFGLLESVISVTAFSFSFSLMSLLVLTFILGWFMLNCFKYLVNKYGFMPFAIYRVCLGILLLFLN